MLRSICSNGPWRRPESKLATLVASTTDMEPVPELDCELSLLFSPNRATGRERRRAGRPESGRETRCRTALLGFARFGEKSGDSSRANYRHLLKESENLAWRIPGMELNKGVYWAVILRKENKDPSNVFTMFILRIFFAVYFKLQTLRGWYKMTHDVNFSFSLSQLSILLILSKREGRNL